MEPYLAEIERLRIALAAAEARAAAAEARLAALEIRIAELTAALEEARRGGKRQAAPFRKPGGPKKNPKKPGRKPGEKYGKQARRAVPEEAEIDEIHVAPLPDACPQCTVGEIEPQGVVEQFHTEIPREPIVRKFRIAVGRCRKCGRRVQGRHPLQCNDALGAAASQFGPRAHAALALLNKRAGLSHGKIAVIFREMFGISVSRGEVARSVLRTGEKCRPAEAEIRERVRNSVVVVADETGWRIAGLIAWLHVLTTAGATWYGVAETRGAETARKVLGDLWNGTLVHDGWSPYDRFAHASHQQCLAHIMRRCHEISSTAGGETAKFATRVNELFKTALEIRKSLSEGHPPPDESARAAEALTEQMKLLATGKFRIPVKRRLAKHLLSHLDDWFEFLRKPGVPATSNEAERALRPAVVNRKVWGGNRTPAGAIAQGILSSVIATCGRIKRDVMEFLSSQLTSREPLPLFAAEG